MDTQLKSFSSVSRGLIVGASVFIIIFGMQYAADILNPFFLAVTITLIFSPFLHWLQRKGAPTWLALTLVILSVVVAGLVLIGLVSISVAQIDENMPQYQARLVILRDQVVILLDTYNVEAENIADLSIFDPEKLLAMMGGFLSGISAAAANSVMLLFMISFMLIDASDMPKKLRSGLGANNAAMARFAHFNRSIRDYVSVKAWLGAAAAIANTALLLFIGVDFAIMWGLLSFLMSFIPNIGYLIALIPPLILALLQFGFTEALIVLGGYFIINTLIDSIIGPKFMGEGLNISPLVVFLSLIMWGWVFGALGALLAVPLTIMVKQLVLESSDSTRWLAEIMSASPSLMMTEEESADINSTDEEVEST